MGQFMIRRTLYALVTLFILSLTIFTVVRLTGDPVTLLAEPGARAAPPDRGGRAGARTPRRPKATPGTPAAARSRPPPAPAGPSARRRRAAGS